MRQVRDRLYIGNITDANAVIQSADLQVTHVLSLLSNQFPYQQKLTQLKPGEMYSVVTMRAGVHYLPSPTGEECTDEDPESSSGREFIRMMMPLRDMESENLLDRLEPCLDFIDEGRKIGDVLVHCLAGVSRSASVVTAYLMRTEKISLDDALTSLRQASQGVCPNEGFMDQLKMFEEMGFKVDLESAIYKQFHLSKLGEAFGKGEKIKKCSFATDPGSDSTSLAESFKSQVKLEEEYRVANLYRCRKCRRLVASESNVISHSTVEEEPSFRLKRKGGGRGHDGDYGSPKCTSIFVEPMQWMTTVIEGGQVEGKLFCVKCQARLGNFHWAGLQCSCGAWVNPAFQLHKSRMDLTWT